MKRVLTFDDSAASKAAFEILYLALLAAEMPARSLGVLRQELATVTAIEGISAPALDAQGAPLMHPAGFPLRNLVAPAELALEQPQVDLLLQRLERVAWRTHGAQAVIDVADRLASAPAQ